MNLSSPKIKDLYDYLCPDNIPHKDRIEAYCRLVLNTPFSLSTSDLIPWTYIMEWGHTVINPELNTAIMLKVLNRGLKTYAEKDWNLVDSILKYAHDIKEDLISQTKCEYLYKWLFAKEYQLKLELPTPSDRKYISYSLSDNNHNIINRVITYLSPAEIKFYAHNILYEQLKTFVRNRDRYTLHTNVFEQFNVEPSELEIKETFLEILKTEYPLKCKDDMYNLLIKTTGLLRHVNRQEEYNDVVKTSLPCIDTIIPYILTYVESIEIKKKTTWGFKQSTLNL